MKPQDRLRLTWQPPGMARPATLQIALTPSADGKTAFRIHLERLPSAESREEMKTHWKSVLEGLAKLAGKSR